MDIPEPSPQHRSGLEPLLSVTELAEYLGVPVQTIYDWRVHGKGPRAYRFGRRIKFAVSDVAAWLQARRDPLPSPTPGPPSPERG